MMTTIFLIIDNKNGCRSICLFILFAAVVVAITSKLIYQNLSLNNLLFDYFHKQIKSAIIVFLFYNSRIGFCKAFRTMQKLSSAFDKKEQQL